MARSLKKVAVIGDKDTALGFAMAGVKDIFVLGPGEKGAQEVLERCIAEQKIGIVVITERIADGLREDIDRLKFDKELYPIIIEMPDKQGEIPGRKDPISLLIKRAIGVEVSKK